MYFSLLPLFYFPQPSPNNSCEAMFVYWCVKESKENITSVSYKEWVIRSKFEPQSTNMHWAVSHAHLIFFYDVPCRLSKDTISHKWLEKEYKFTNGKVIHTSFSTLVSNSSLLLLYHNQNILAPSSSHKVILLIIVVSNQPFFYKSCTHTTWLHYVSSFWTGRISNHITL